MPTAVMSLGHQESQERPKNKAGGRQCQVLRFALQPIRHGAIRRQARHYSAPISAQIFPFMPAAADHRQRMAWWNTGREVPSTCFGRNHQRLSMQISPLALAAAVCLTAVPAVAVADVQVRFIEGAPKDQFVITNESRCAVTTSELIVDLSGSAAGLIFDVAGDGAGVEVFQPFALLAGAGALNDVPKVGDGDTRVSLSIRSLAPRAQIAFTIDVDDTLGQRGITISDAEISGATVRLVSAGVTRSGTFSPAGVAVVQTPACS